MIQNLPSHDAALCIQQSVSSTSLVLALLMTTEIIARVDNAHTRCILQATDREFHKRISRIKLGLRFYRLGIL
jgi:hypothetical protein